MALRIGFALNFATAARATRDVREVYEQVIDTIAFAEELGLDSVWVGQHHFDNTDGPVPSPLVFLAAVAGRTDRITIGTGITTLPLEDPLRLAEDAATLDVLADGRLQLGLGTGGANLDGFRSFGLDSAQRHALYDEKLRRFSHVVSGGSLVDGQDGPHLYPPVPELRSRIWRAATTEERAREGARAGDGLQLGAFFDPAGSGQAPRAAAYHDELARAHPELDPRVATFRFVYLGDSTASVVAELEPVLGPNLAFMAKRAAVSGNTELGTWSVEQYLDAVTLYGSPEDVVAQIHRDPVIDPYASDFVANFSYREEFSAVATRRRLELLATEIGPALGWRPATRTHDQAVPHV